MKGNVKMGSSIEINTFSALVKHKSFKRSTFKNCEEPIHNTKSLLNFVGVANSSKRILF